MKKLLADAFEAGLCASTQGDIKGEAFLYVSRLSSKLTHEQKREIRQAYIDGFEGVELITRD